MKGKKADIIIFDEMPDNKTDKPEDPANKAGQRIGYIGGVIVLILVFALVVIGLMKLGCWLLML